jgi:hypothetical protein
MASTKVVPRTSIWRHPSHLHRREAASIMDGSEHQPSQIWARSHPAHGRFRAEESGGTGL